MDTAVFWRGTCGFSVSRRSRPLLLLWGGHRYFLQEKKRSLRFQRALGHSDLGKTAEPASRRLSGSCTDCFLSGTAGAEFSLPCGSNLKEPADRICFSIDQAKTLAEQYGQPFSIKEILLTVKGETNFRKAKESFSAAEARE